MTATGQTILDTTRLHLRELVADDLDFLAGMLADPAVDHHYDRRFSREAANEWLHRQMERYQTDGHGLWLAVEKETGAPVGQVGLVLQTLNGEKRPEIGWLLDRAHWGKGFATEAGAAVRDAAFARWHYPEVIALIRPENTSSQRVAERIGMIAGPRVIYTGRDHILYRAGREAAH
jgi:RimJ/RimL family protein N-acetyltransferase